MQIETNQDEVEKETMVKLNVLVKQSRQSANESLGGAFHIMRQTLYAKDDKLNGGFENPFFSLKLPLESWFISTAAVSGFKSSRSSK
ncbi:hypothetical protein V6N13_013505 [Hibiscus sabdariffa]